MNDNGILIKVSRKHLEKRNTVNSLLTDTYIVELVPAFLYSPYLTLYKTDFSLRRTRSSGSKSVRFRES